jgi:hypothetical protein
MQAARGRRGGSASAAAIERAERERKAIALRLQNWSFEEIAVELGFADRSGARKAVERGLSRWMRETDEDFRARELEHTEMIIDRLMPMIDRDEPDLKAIDRLLKTMDHRAKIMGLYAKRPTVPDTYPDAPTRAAEDKAQMVARYSELINKITAGVIESGYVPGVTPYDDEPEEDDAVVGPESHSDDPTSDADCEHDVLEPRDRHDGKPFRDGEWVDGKFVPSNPDDPGTDAIRPESGEGVEATATVAEAFRISGGS